MARPPPLLRRPRPDRGYTLLAVLIIIAALLLLAFAGLQYAQSERRNSAIDRDNEIALAIAEAGLERTLAYLDDINNRDSDLDRALDPFLDTTCSGSFPTTLAGNQLDDNLPVYSDPDAGVATVAPGGRRYRVVPNQGGAYLVRIEDNDDDGLDAGYDSSTSNNGCTEGASIRSNPIRDRDRTVVVNVIGIYPGLDYTQARARRAIRVMAGPGKPQGVIGGGNVDLHDNGTHVCGAYADVVAGQNLTDGRLCYSGCPGGATPCVGQAGGGTCSADTTPGPATCTAGVTVPQPPVVDPWDKSNAPGPCVGGVCVPFYYVRYNTGTSKVEILMWDYGTNPANCANPRRWSRICRPGDTDPSLAICATCWTMVTMSTSAGVPVNMVDAPGLTLPTPDGGTADGGTPVSWAYLGAGPGSIGGPCSDRDSDAGYPYPTDPGLRVGDMPPHELGLTPGAPGPRGVWFVEGDVRATADTPACPGWNASVMTVGNLVLPNNRDLEMTPAAEKGYALLVGRDFDMGNGHTTFKACSPGAVMVHEQMNVGGNASFEGQLVVEDHATCSSTISGPSIVASGSVDITVPWPPPVYSGRLTTPQVWSESSY